MEFIGGKEDEEPFPTDVANRTNEFYRAVSSIALAPHDIIRVKR